jgi:hypothetical protein
MREILGLAWLAVAAAAVTTAFVRARRGDDAPLRAAFLEATVTLGVATVLGVELTSAATRLAPAPLAAFWAGVAIAAAVVAVRLGDAHPSRGLLVTLEPYLATPQRRILLALLGTFAIVTFVTATATPPNNWDAMTYHMPRVAHWLANGSLRHYPIARTQQLFMPPLNARSPRCRRSRETTRGRTSCNGRPTSGARRSRHSSCGDCTADPPPSSPPRSRS